MDKKKKIMIVVGLLAIGGVAYYMYQKKKKAGQVGGGGAMPQARQSGGSETNRQCQGVKEASGKGKGKALAIDGGRSTATKLWKKGGMVSVDGGTPTQITGVYKDKNGQVGAVYLADGTSNGTKMCKA
jgi:hypothetical protein